MKKILSILLAVLLLLASVGCSSMEPSVELVPPPPSPSYRGTLPTQKPSHAPVQTQEPETEESDIPAETEIPTAEPTPDPTPTPTPEPTPTPTPEPTPTPTPEPTPSPTPAPAPTNKPSQSSSGNQGSSGSSSSSGTGSYSSGGIMVWIPKTGSKYHSTSTCSNMKNPSHVTLSYAQANGYTRCKKCW